MSNIDTQELSTLFESLTLQSRVLIDEISQFQHYIATRPTLSSTLASAPPLVVTKFLADVRHENELLSHHGSALNLASPLYIPPAPPGPGDQDVNLPSAATIAGHAPTWSIPHRLQARIDKSTSTSISTSTSAHRIRSSNIPFLSAIWTELKCSHGIIAIRKHVRYLPPSAAQHQPLGPVGSRGSQGARQRQQQKDSLNRQNMGGTTSLAKIPRRVRGSDGVVRRADKEPVTVDIVTEHGGRWIKIVTKSAKSMVMDLAKEGLVDFGVGEDGHGSEEEEEEEHYQEVHCVGRNGEQKDETSPTNASGIMIGDDSALSELKLVKTANDFLAAARTARVGLGHEHPQIYFHLTKIERGHSKDVDAVIRYIERLGVRVVSADQLTIRDGGAATVRKGKACNIPCTADMYEHMLAPIPQPSPTDTLNIDCTILIALVSDISHSAQSQVDIPVHYHGRQAGKDITLQLASEPQDPLLPNHIYPILRGRRLVCTTKAVAHLRNIVSIMGSSTETKRSNLLLPCGPEDRRERGDLSSALQQLSKYQVPEDLQLPIQVIEDGVVDVQVCEGRNNIDLEAEVRKRLSRHPRLSPLNRSVFFYGWQERITTVSLNRDVSEWLDRAIDATLDDVEAEDENLGSAALGEGFEGPKVLICGRERSLLGSEKK